jgi:diguanylate cyclase (GGDEF)-like protein
MARMLIDAAELAHRKELLSFTEADVSFLVRAGPFVIPEIENIIEEFYRVQLSFPEVASIIGNDETLRRLRSAQRTYIDDLFSGDYDESYANNRLRIGLVHKQIGVQPKYYLSATKTLLDILKNIVVTQVCDGDLALGITAALEKLISLDSALVIEAYLQTTITELEVSAERALAYNARMKEKIAEIEALSRTDALTGLLNRRAFLEELKKELGRAKRHVEPVSLLYVDVDNFKAINDGYGHSKGDEELNLIARVLREVLRGTDFAGRIGGDEFCVAYSGDSIDQARTATDRFLARLHALTSTTVSTGIASTGPKEFLHPDELIARADKLMIEAKSKSALLRWKAAALH